MARKRKTYRRKARAAKPATRRRRRVGATALNMSASSPLVKFGSIALGYFFGDKLNAQLVKVVGDKLDPKILAAGEAGLGALLVLKKGKKGMLQTVVGGVLLGAGAKALMASMGIGAISPYGRVPVIGGYGEVPVVGKRRLNGYTPNSRLGNYTPNMALNSVKPVMGSVFQKGSGSGLTPAVAGSELMG